MLVPLSWLRDFAPIEGDPAELAATLSNLGLVVDGVQRVGGEIDGVVVARVLALRPHPDADKIQLVDVDPGDGGPLQIACGAFNFAVGDLVPLATVGTVLPDGTGIGRRKLRGEWSNGMLCSAAELGLPDPEGGRGILVLPAEGAAPGTPVSDALAIEADVVFDLDISPNRPDALSMAGVARDLAAALRVPFSLPSATAPVAGAMRRVPVEPGAMRRVTVDPSVERASIEVLDPDLCPRFTGTVLTGVALEASPAWMARRLTLSGMRPINRVVDVSNYVMLELGQPNHAYDLERLPGRGLLVRRARAGEVLVTLDGVERRLGPDDCLICDAHSTPVGIGGIMGGASSEISATTRTVLLEAAYFTPMAIARTGKRLGLHTEARARFERGTDPQMIELAVDRFAALLPDTARGEVVDVRAEGLVPRPRRVTVRTDRVNAILGTSLADGAIADLLAPIGFEAAPGPVPGVQEVTIPTWRPDSEREIDVIEEVGRLHGYRNITRTLPGGVRAGGGLTRYQRRRRLVRNVLAGAGLSEAWTTTFLGPGDLERAGLPGEAVEVENPLDRSESLLRTSLLPGLLKAVRFNVDRQEPDVRLFEIGRVFWPPAERTGSSDGQGGVRRGEEGGVPGADRADGGASDRGGDGGGDDGGDDGGDGGGRDGGVRPALARTLSGASPVPVEREDLACVVAGEGAGAELAARLWAILADALRLDGIRLEAAELPGFHPTRAARIVASGTPGTVGPGVRTRSGGVASVAGEGGEVVVLGVIGEVAPEVVAAYGLSGRIGAFAVSLEDLLTAVPERSEQALPISRFPSSDYDLAFAVPDTVAAGDVETTLRQAGGELVERVRLFDVYRGPGLGTDRRSLAYHVRLRALERTLTDADVGQVRRRQIEAVATALGGELRG